MASGLPWLHKRERAMVAAPKEPLASKKYIHGTCTGWGDLGLTSSAKILRFQHRRNERPMWCPNSGTEELAAGTIKAEGKGMALCGKPRGRIPQEKRNIQVA